MIIAPRKRNFTKYPNDILYNPAMSGRAKHIHLTLLSFKDDWEFSNESVLRKMKEGIKYLNVGIAELKKFGLIVKIKYIGKGNRVKKWKTVVFENAFHQKDFLRENHFTLNAKNQVVIPESPKGYSGNGIPEYPIRHSGNGDSIKI